MSSQNLFGYPFIELLSVDSTNNYAMQMVHAGMARHGTVVFAHEQTKGKGQRQKQWISNAGENIMMSLILKPKKLVISQQFLLSMAMAVGALQFVNFHTNGDAAIKWPNDIYWRDRKAGGILIENVLNGSEWKYAIVGLGLNVNQTVFTSVGTKAVSLKQITSKDFDTIALAKQLLLNIQTTYESLLEDSEAMIQSYHHSLFKRNEKVFFRKNNKVFEALVKGVTPSGQLIAERSIEEYYSIGEVEWIMDR